MRPASLLNLIRISSIVFVITPRETTRLYRGSPRVNDYNGAALSSLSFGKTSAFCFAGIQNAMRQNNESCDGRCLSR